MADKNDAFQPWHQHRYRCGSASQQ